MTPRKRKKKKQRLTESAQVELLPEVVPASRGSEEEEAGGVGDTGAATESERAAESGSASDGVPGAAGDELPDRWAKAVGRREPLRPSRRSPPVASDHAAVAVAPAGEPLARAKELVERGRVEEAIELYLGILTVNESNLKAHNNLGVLLDELKQYEAALEHFEAAEQLAPENVEVLSNFASTLTSLARYDEAEGLLRRAQRLAPEDAQVRVGIGVLFFRRGLYSQAETELRWVCARDRSNGVAFYYRGEALNRLGRFEEAKQALEHAADLLPNDPRSFYTLGHLYDRKSMHAEAAEMYRRARQLQAP